MVDTLPQAALQALCRLFFGLLCTALLGVQVYACMCTASWNKFFSSGYSRQFHVFVVVTVLSMPSRTPQNSSLMSRTCQH